MDFKNAPKKRTTNFREDETKLLIQLWGSPIVQNKLYLTHRKAPVMRLIASNMQRHGFYRTPDEIKTRIRNLKCLYHRIKKSMATGAGIGTVDPDWPHYKAMDDILSKKNALRQNLVYNHNLLSEVANGDIKEEVEDIEINDDGESCTSNSNCSDDEFEEPSSLLPSTITPTIIEDDEKIIAPPVKIAPKPITVTVASSQPPPVTIPRIQIAKNLLASTTTSLAPTKLVTTSANTPKLPTATVATNKANGAIPFPLLILNGTGGQNGSAGLMQKAVTGNNNVAGFNAEVSSILKEMLIIQKENLEIERERLEVERQKLEYERTVGSQLMNMVPAFNDIFQRFNKSPELSEEVEEDSKNFTEHPDFNRKRPSDAPLTPPKTNKVFKEVLINGIKKYMQDATVSNSNNTNGDSGIE